MDLFKFEKFLPNLLKQNFFIKTIPYGHDIHRNVILNKLPQENINDTDDVSNLFTYKFDKYGYRFYDNPYDLTKDKKIFCFGCSQTFGHGIKYEDTWPYLLNKYFENHNIYNYGVEGASNSAIFRRIYQFLKYLELNNLSYPKYIFIYFPSFNRDELVYIDGNLKISNIGVWSGKKFQKFLESKTTFYCLFEFIKNFKLIEEMCMARNIKMYWSSWSSYFKVFSKTLLTNYLNCNTILENNYVKVIVSIDFSRDKTHVGKKTNEIRAKNFYEMVLCNN